MGEQKGREGRELAGGETPAPNKLELKNEKEIKMFCLLLPCIKGEMQFIDYSCQN